VLTSHSYGENVARSFLHWVDERSPGWLEEHVEAHVAIAGTTLGVPKALTAALSGRGCSFAAVLLKVWSGLWCFGMTLGVLKAVTAVLSGSGCSSHCSPVINCKACGQTQANMTGCC